MSLTIEEAKQEIDQFAHKGRKTRNELVSYATVLPYTGDVRVLQDYALTRLNNGAKFYPLTDLGNAERLAAKFGDQFHWVTERQRFAVWSGKYWDWDNLENTAMLKFAKATAREIVKETSSEMDDDVYKKVLEWARQSESEKRLKSMISLVRSEDGIALSIAEFNKNPYLFNITNGTIDLKTGILRPHDKEDLITIMAPTKYIKGALCPKWNEFLNLIQGNNQGMIIYLKKLCGYAMTGDTKTQIVPFCHGAGGNGKSTFWSPIRKVMGDYAGEIDPEVFLISRQNFRDSGMREALANLQNKRLVTATEIQENRQLSINLLKAITGGECITGDRKYEHSITFKPTFKVILSGNNEPVIKDNTDAAWRRLKKIPFNIRISNPIEGYESNFDDELPGIFNWMIEGCLLWQSEGLKDTEEVTKATAEYRNNQDVIGSFIEECCEIGVLNSVLQADFYTAYSKWSIESGNSMLTKKQLRDRILAHGDIQTVKAHGNAAAWRGIKLNDYGVTLVTLVTLKQQNTYVSGKSEKLLQNTITNDNQNNPDNSEEAEF